MVRVVIAIVSIYLFVSGTVEGAWGITLMAGAAVLLLTSLFSFCPIYFSVGLSTLRKNLHSKTN